MNGTLSPVEKLNLEEKEKLRQVMTFEDCDKYARNVN